MYYKTFLHDYTRKSIDKCIRNKIYNEEGVLSKVEIHFGVRKLLFKVKPYKSDFPLILSNVKLLLKIPTIMYDVTYIEDKPYLIYLDKSSVKLSDYLNYNIKKYKERLTYTSLDSESDNSEDEIPFESRAPYSVPYKIPEGKNITSYYSYLNNSSLLLLRFRQLIAFNWVMCLSYPHNVKVENNILVEPYFYEPCEAFDTYGSDAVVFIYTNEDLNINTQYTKKFISGDFDTPKTIIREYFNNSQELFYEHVSRIVMNIDPNKLKFELLKIVNYHNKEYIPWVNLVYERVLNAKNF